MRPESPSRRLVRSSSEASHREQPVRLATQRRSRRVDRFSREDVRIPKAQGSFVRTTTGSIVATRGLELRRGDGFPRARVASNDGARTLTLARGA
jgi:hypothetical protein